jgi:hypothetical protein
MKKKSLIIPVITLGLITVLIPRLNAQEQAQEQRVIIPPEVKTVMQAGMQSREPRLDIPFTFIDKEVYLPAQMNLHRVFFFKVKNADLGFSAPAQPGEKPEKKEEQEVSSFESQPAMLQARNHLFMQFRQLDGTFSQEVYIPMNLQVDGTGYDPEKEELYTIGYPMPAGKYVLAAAIGSQKLEKIGTQYLEFELPNPASYTDTLGITPVFFVTKMNQMSAPETRTEIHKDFFTYSVLQVEANMDHVFTAGDNLDVFFFIFGAQPNEQGRNDIEVTYEVAQNEEAIIRYAQTAYEMALVSQPLPLKKTVLIRTTKEGETTERQEQRDLEPGTYTLSIDITDKLSGKTYKEIVPFEIK